MIKLQEETSWLGEHIGHPSPRQRLPPKESSRTLPGENHDEEEEEEWEDPIFWQSFLKGKSVWPSIAGTAILQSYLKINSNFKQIKVVSDCLRTQSATHLTAAGGWSSWSTSAAL